MSTAISSSDSSRRMLGPPLALSTTARTDAGGMTERRIPRVQKSASTWGSSGTMSMSMRSSPVVGPRN
jgi:hypothetical protein